MMDSMMILNNIKEEAIKNNIPIIKDEALEKVRKYIDQNNLKYILEIGSAVGYSAISFALINEDIKVFTIEKDEDRYNIALDNIEKMNLGNRIKIQLGDANDIIKSSKFKEEYNEFLNDNKFDMLFLDAAKGQYLNFFKNGIENLRSFGYIIADNVLFKGYVLGEYKEKKHRTIVNNLREFLEEIRNPKKYDTAIFDIDDGLSVTKMKY